MVPFSKPPEHSAFLGKLLLFCRQLKDSGINPTLSRIIDAYRSLALIDIFDYQSFYYALRTNLISCREDMRTFDRVFFAYWGLARKSPLLVEQGGEKTSAELGDGKDAGIPQMNLEAGQEAAVQLEEGEHGEDTELCETPLYSMAEKLRMRDFSTFSEPDMAELKKAIALIARKMRLRESYRKKAVNKARFFDFRKTIRKSIRHGGDFLRIAWKSGKITKTKIVLLCDVSGSMERYSRFLIQFLYGLQRSLYHLETFVFGTRLSRLTTILRKEGFEGALDRISRLVLDWAGGTRIGECLGTFNRQYAPTLLSGRTILLIISDGWDRGDEVMLRNHMRELRRRAYHIIWLNPLLGSPDYQPLCQGMRTALPFLDQFLPLHNMQSLTDLAHVLSRIR